MKKLIILLFAGLIWNLTSVQDLDAGCKETRIACLEECNENYSGETFFDGLGRFGCRAGCEISEGICNTAEFIKELFE
ncbi:MAG: hypothetical protein FH748_03240 [Balneolaceae bacterium]|nr:hypothetical protein [Balneolaceae bacterium]